MSWDEVAAYAPKVIGTLLLLIGGRIARDLHRISESVEKLNTQLAVVVTQIGQHEKRLDRLEDRVG